MVVSSDRGTGERERHGIRHRGFVSVAVRKGGDDFPPRRPDSGHGSGRITRGGRHHRAGGHRAGGRTSFRSHFGSQSGNNLRLAGRADDARPDFLRRRRFSPQWSLRLPDWDGSFLAQNSFKHHYTPRPGNSGQAGPSSRTHSLPDPVPSSASTPVPRPGTPDFCSRFTTTATVQCYSVITRLDK